MKQNYLPGQSKIQTIGSQGLNAGVIALLLLLIFSHQANATQYFLKTSGASAPQTPSNWSTVQDGGTDYAGTFRVGTDDFKIASGISATLSTGWTIGSTGGTNATLSITVEGTLTLASGGSISLDSRNNSGSSTSLIVNSGGVLVFSGTSASQISVTGGASAIKNFTLNSGATVRTANTSGFYGTGTESFNSTGIDNLTQSTGVSYEFTGAAQSMTGITATVNNLTFSGSGTKTYSTVTSITGTFTVASGCTTSLGTGAISMGAFSNSGLVTSTSNTLSITGNFSDNGTYTHNSGTVTFNGSSQQTINGSSATTFNAVTLNNSTGAVLGSSKTINGTLTFTSGKLSLNGFTLTLGGAVSGMSATNSFTGSSTSNLTLNNASTGNVFFDQTTPGTTNLLKNLSLGTSATATLGNALNIVSGASAGVVTVASGGVLTTGGFLTLKSDASGSGSIGNSAGSVSGNVIVERNIPSGKRAYRLLSHPFSTAIALSSLSDDIHITGSGGSGSGFDNTTTNSPSAFTFTESEFVGTSNTGWNAFTNASTTIAAKQAIRIFYRGPRSQSNLLDGTNPTPNEGTLDWSGPVNQGAVNVAMTFTSGNGGNAGWNLIPNPYPSRVDIGSIAAGSRNNISSFSYWAPNNGTRGAYVSGTFGSSFIIPQGSAFFVQTTSAANFSFAESNKSTSSVSAVLLKSDPLLSNALQIDVLSDDTIFWDQYVFRNRENALDAIDPLDGPKMENPDVNFYSLAASGEKLAIDNRAIQSENLINLGFTTPSNYHFTYRVSHLDISGYEVYLKDIYLNKELLLEENLKYDFVTNTDANSKGDRRFQLLFKQSSVNGINQLNVAENNFTLYPNPATTAINLALTTTKEGEYQFSIYDGMGKEVNNGSLDFAASRNHSIQIESLSSGIYFVKIGNDKSSQTIRFVK